VALPAGGCYAARTSRSCRPSGSPASGPPPLRVAVLSTGDELVSDPARREPHQIYDANRPMLLACLAGWGFEPVDLGHAPDDAGEIAARSTGVRARRMRS
jgi:hypothetical protein